MTKKSTKGSRKMVAHNRGARHKGVQSGTGPQLSVPPDTATVGSSTGESRDTTRIRLGLWMTVLGLMGLGVSAYLAFAHYRDISTICLQGMECDAVLSSAYAQVLGIPLAVLGLGMYFAVVILGLLVWRGPVESQGPVGLIAYSVALAATLWTLYLYYLEAFEIHAFCTWCVVSSLLVFALMALSVANLLLIRRRGLQSREPAPA